MAITKRSVKGSALTAAEHDGNMDELIAIVDPGINTQTGTSYTLVAGDKNKTVTLTNASAITLTVPSLGLIAGAEITIAQLGAGQVTVAASGTTVNVHADDTLKLDGQHSWATLKLTATNVWSLIGRLEPA